MCTRVLSLFIIMCTNVYGVRLLDFPKKPVLDQAGILESKQEEYLNQRVADFMDQTSMEIRLVTVDDVSPYPTASAYAEDLYHKWKLGDKDKHNGLLLLIARHIGSDSVDMKDYCRIMTGWGIVTIIPDSVVIEDIKHGHMMPQLPHQPFLAFDNSLDRIFEDISSWKKNNPADTTIVGKNVPIRVERGSRVDISTSSPTSSSNLPWGWIIGVVVVLLLVAFFFRHRRSRRLGGYFSGSRSGGWDSFFGCSGGGGCSGGSSGCGGCGGGGGGCGG